MSRDARAVLAVSIGSVLFVGLGCWAGATSGIYLHGCECAVYGWGAAWRVGAAALLGLVVIGAIGAAVAWVMGGER